MSTSTHSRSDSRPTSKSTSTPRSVPTRKPPLPTIRKIVKGHSNKRVSRGVDGLVYLNYILFMERLMENARVKGKEEGRGNGKGKIEARDLRKVTLTTLRQFRG